MLKTTLGKVLKGISSLYGDVKTTLGNIKSKFEKCASAFGDFLFYLDRDGHETLSFILFVIVVLICIIIVGIILYFIIMYNLLKPLLLLLLIIFIFELYPLFIKYRNRD